VIKLRDTLQDIIKGCEICQCNTPTTLPCLSLEFRGGGHIQGRTSNWELDFTHLPGGPASRLLLGLVDTFTGCVEAFPSSSEKAQ
jgi:hypothetical protein